MTTRTRAPKKTPRTTTLAINDTSLSVNKTLLTEQAAALGRVLGPPTLQPGKYDAALLEGVWNFLHRLLDAA